MKRPLPFLSTLLPLFLLAGCASQKLVDTRAEIAAPTTSHAIPAGKPFVSARALIILRHADIDVTQKATMGNATPLLPRGQDRAKEIVTALKDAGITRIITSSALRTQDTAAPLASLLNLKTDDVGTHLAENGMPSASEGDKVLAYLAATAKPDQTILLVHHHSVIPAIMAGLGFDNEPPYVDATEFDRVYLLIPNPETRTYQLFRLRYGGTW